MPLSSPRTPVVLEVLMATSRSTPPRSVGAIEAGGTTFVCAVGDSWNDVMASEKFVVATTSPEATLGRVLDWLAARHGETPLAAIGVASFGPLDLAKGRIARSTPKIEWRAFDWIDAIAQRFDDLPVALDTDTNGAGLAESRWGASRGKRVSVYVTVGTGIGGAVILNGKPLHGLTHPEMGHMFVPRHPSDTFEGVCPAHGDCLEGLASAPAVATRWNEATRDLPMDHPAWELESYYLAEAVANLTAVLSPEMIVLGGGLMSANGLLDLVREKTRGRANGYYVSDLLNEHISRYLESPGLGEYSGVVGAYALGSDLITS